MATQSESRGGLLIEGIAADWSFIVSKPPFWSDLPRIASIQFDPGAAADKLVVKDGSDTGAVRCSFGPVDGAGDQRIKYFFGARFSPYIDFSDCTLSAGHRVIIELWSEA
uniref:Uncharacterized protein n=1 Tax=viral metagenome TaxID=1070528 RepID=A0A6M3IPF9_9ZZZZ